MPLTNILGLPEPLYNATKSDYIVEENIYSATTLLKDPKEIILCRRHADEIIEDCSDLIYSLLGTSVHYILSKNKEKDTEFKEERIYMDIDGMRISGQFDLYDASNGGELSDYKVVSVWQTMLGDNEKYRLQLLIYAYILKSHGFPCSKGRIIQIYRDFSKTKASTDSSYPQKPVNVINFKFTDEDFVYIESYIKEKLEQIKECNMLPDDDISICSEKERWKTEDKYAVMSKNRKSAQRVLNSEELAVKWMEDNKKGDFIEKRNGENKKCNSYCRCREFCNFYKESLKH